MTTAGQNTTTLAWKNAETACFAFWCAKLGGTADEDAFLGAVPFALPDGAHPNVWAFSFYSSDDFSYAWPNRNQVSVSWLWKARINGLFSDREEGQKFVGKILDWQPAGKQHGTNTISYVQSIRVISLSLEPNWLPVANSDNMVRMWELTVEFTVCFDNAA